MDVDILRNAKTEGKDWRHSLRQMNVKRQELRISVFDTTKYLDTIWK